jgi:hypothetical protein
MVYPGTYKRGLTTEARFWQYVEKKSPDECWNWLNYKNPKGYGYWRLDARKVIHVTHYALITSGKERPAHPYGCALHSCDNPSCVNPAHLRWGSKTENNKERDEKGRHWTHRGQAHPHAVQNTVANRAFKKMICEWPASQRELASRLTISQQTISEIRLGKIWIGVG